MMAFLPLMSSLASNLRPLSIVQIQGPCLTGNRRVRTTLIAIGADWPSINGGSSSMFEAIHGYASFCHSWPIYFGVLMAEA